MVRAHPATTCPRPWLESRVRSQSQRRRHSRRTCAEGDGLGFGDASRAKSRKVGFPVGGGLETAPRAKTLTLQ